MIWRNMDTHFRQQLADKYTVEMQDKWKVGAITLGGDADRVFQGDPLDHATEEVLDLLFYLEMAKREREELRDQLRSALLRVRWPDESDKAFIREGK